MLGNEETPGVKHWALLLLLLLMTLKYDYAAIDEATMRNITVPYALSPVPSVGVGTIQIT